MSVLLQLTNFKRSSVIWVIWLYFITEAMNVMNLWRWRMCNVFVVAKQNCVMTKWWLGSVFYLLLDLQPLLTSSTVKKLVNHSVYLNVVVSSPPHCHIYRFWYVLLQVYSYFDDFTFHKGSHIPMVCGKNFPR